MKEVEDLVRTSASISCVAEQKLNDREKQDEKGVEEIVAVSRSPNILPPPAEDVTRSSRFQNLQCRRKLTARERSKRPVLQIRSFNRFAADRSLNVEK